MDNEKFARLEKKYSGFSPGKSTPHMGPGRGGPMAHAMSKKGKPKNAIKTIIKLLNYLSGQKFLLISALICALIHTAASLTSSYMLRPIMNRFLYYDTSGMTERLTGLAAGIAIETM